LLSIAACTAYLAGPLEVRYRALAKKIRQCEELEGKKKTGVELDRWQQAKLRKKLFLKAGLHMLNPISHTALQRRVLLAVRLVQLVPRLGAIAPVCPSLLDTTFDAFEPEM
jgi:hypothetical protein